MLRQPLLEALAHFQPRPDPLAKDVMALRFAHTRFLAFGDSLTSGTTSPAVSPLPGLPPGEATNFPSKLLAMLRATYPTQVFEVKNEGQPGEPASEGVRRFPGVLRRAGPGVVIILHGVNDVTFLGMRGVRAVAAFIQAMARDAKSLSVEVAICTQNPHRAGGLRAGDLAVIAAYNDALREVASGEGALLVDFDRSVDLTVIGQDGLHPTEQGYVQMGQVLFDALRGRFELAP